MKISVILLADMETSSGTNFVITAIFVGIIILLTSLREGRKHAKEKKESELNPLEFSESDSGAYFFVVKVAGNKILLKNNTMHNSHAHYKERWYKTDAIPIEFQKKRIWLKVIYSEGKIQFSKDDMHHF